MTKYQIITPNDLDKDGELKKGAGLEFDPNTGETSSLKQNQTDVSNRKNKNQSQNNKKKNKNSKENSTFLSTPKEQVNFVNENKKLIDLIPKNKVSNTNTNYTSGYSEYDDNEETPYLFISILLSFALTTLFIIFDYMVFLQFHMVDDYHFFYRFSRKYIPVLACNIFIIYGLSRYVEKLAIQILLLTLSCYLGIQVVSIAGNHSTFGDMLKTPGLIIMWAYCVIQMRFLPALFNVMVVLVYYYKDTLIFTQPSMSSSGLY